tara:strand:+ start:261 stop:494 length:234 start_codon:yes stop_codon:yes gene_type:complete
MHAARVFDCQQDGVSFFALIQRIQLFMWTNQDFKSDRHWCYLRLLFEGGHALAPNIRPPPHFSSIFVHAYHRQFEYP